LCAAPSCATPSSAFDLAGRRTIHELEGGSDKHLAEYTNPRSDRYTTMVDRIGQRLSLTSLRYQELPDLVESIGLPKERICTYCWDGCDGPCRAPKGDGDKKSSGKKDKE